MAQDEVKHEPQPVRTAAKTPPANTAGVLILQWLTYAFWGWLIVGLIWLISVVLVNAIVGTPVSGVVPYAIAASIVLLPLAFTTDFFYRKHEPARKTGAAIVIMVIHAVIFALLGIGALITSVFTGLNAFINIAENNDSVTVVVLVAAFATLAYAAAFLRTLNPFKKIPVARIYAFSMLGATILLLIFAVVGPVVTTIATRDDRQIEQSLPTVDRAIRSYVTLHDELPASLNDITVRESSAKDLIKDGEITYKPEGSAVETGDSSLQRTYLRYQLCVEYDRPSENADYYDTYYDETEADGYISYLSVTPHLEGDTCYRLRAYQR